MRRRVGSMKSRGRIRKKDFVSKVSKSQLSRMIPFRRTVVKSIIKGQEKLYKFNKKVERWSKKK